jgi:ribosomal protein S12 methylthiotransferase accessory factor
VTSSNGLACHATLGEAVVAGLYEVLERDCFMLAWASRLSLPLLDIGGDAGLSAFHDRYLARTGLRYALVDMSAFWDLPVVTAVVRCDVPGEAPIGVGARASSTAEHAVRKALDEAFHVRSWARSLLSRDPERVFEPDFSDVREFSDHIRFYAAREHTEHVAFLDASPVRRPVGDVPPLGSDGPAEELALLTGRLAAHGITAYAVDLTPPDIVDAGLRVAKVVAPELCPLDFDHRLRHLGGRRLRYAAWELGLVPEPLAQEDVNPFPHPFP